MIKDYYDYESDPLFVPVKYPSNASINSDYKKNIYMIFSRKTVSRNGINNKQIYCFNMYPNGIFRVDPLPVFDAMKQVKGFNYHIVIRGIFEMDLDGRARDLLSQFGEN